MEYTCRNVRQQIHCRRPVSQTDAAAAARVACRTMRLLRGTRPTYFPAGLAGSTAIAIASA
jgi:hypothetical protein